MEQMDFMLNKLPSIPNRNDFMSIEQDFSNRNFPSLLDEFPAEPLSYFVPTIPIVTEEIFSNRQPPINIANDPVLKQNLIEDILQEQRNNLMIDDFSARGPVDMPLSIFEDRNYDRFLDNQIPTFNMDDFLMRNGLYQTPEDKIMQDQNKLDNIMDSMGVNNQANLMNNQTNNTNYGSGQQYAQSIAGGQNVANMIAPGVGYSSANPQGFTQTDINTGVVPNPFEYAAFVNRGPSLPKMQNPPQRADQLFIDDGPGSLGRENELRPSSYSPLNLAGIQKMLDNLG